MIEIFDAGRSTSIIDKPDMGFNLTEGQLIGRSEVGFYVDLVGSASAVNRTRKVASPNGMPSKRMAAECIPGF